MIAGTGSGCGKTTVACALLQALHNRGLKVQAFKCGPDYIDPMYHRMILGEGGINLDSFFFSENTLNMLLAKHGQGKDISIIEGVMGFYDGLGISTTRASSMEIAQMTETPVVLIADARGAALSVLAVISGFLDFIPENQICGVILNRCSPGTAQLLSDEIHSRFNGRVQPLGCLPKREDCAFESRYLGLRTASEDPSLRDRLMLLEEQAEKTIDLDRLLELAGKSPDIRYSAPKLTRFSETVRIGIAKDKAFCFYYQDNPEILAEMGAELVPFSPLTDKTLPANLHGLYIGGGYPELYREELSHNTTMRNSVRLALERGMPCIAECGGFMYLTQSIAGSPMVGFLRGNCFETGKLTRFGYISLRANEDSMLSPAGGVIPGHEFHYWDCDEPGNAFTAVKHSGKSWTCAVASNRLYAGFPHFHFYANPDIAARFVQACIRFREEQHV